MRRRIGRMIVEVVFLLLVFGFYPTDNIVQAGKGGVPKSDGDWTVSGTDMYSNVAGYVGIGTTSPEAKLHIGGTAGVDGIKFPDGTVQTTATSSWTDGFETVSTTGSVRIGDDSADCTPANAGTIRFTGIEFEGCDGTTWVSFTLAAPPASFACGVDQVQDADGQWYDTVRIGSQCWMAENLNVGNRVHGSIEMTDNGTTEKYCYNNSPTNCLTDGGLYQWDEMMQFASHGGVQGICPSGWHLPTDSEWKAQEMALGMTQADADNAGWRGTDQGNQMKKAADCFGGVNCGTSGFEALLAGTRTPEGSFFGRGEDTLFWSSTERGVLASDGWLRLLSLGDERVFRGGTVAEAHGLSVRCVKD